MVPVSFERPLFQTSRRPTENPPRRTQGQVARGEREQQHPGGLDLSRVHILRGEQGRPTRHDGCVKGWYVPKQPPVGPGESAKLDACCVLARLFAVRRFPEHVWQMLGRDVCGLQCCIVETRREEVQALLLFLLPTGFLQPMSPERMGSLQPMGRPQPMGSPQHLGSSQPMGSPQPIRPPRPMILVDLGAGRDRLGVDPVSIWSRWSIQGGPLGCISSGRFCRPPWSA